MTDPQANDSLFQTPNPTELKQAAKQDPLSERLHQPEADAVEVDADAKTEIGQPDAADFADSQVTQANLSGH